MPLFESQKKRTDRLLTSSLAISIESVETVEPETVRGVAEGILVAASLAAETFVSHEPLKSLWGKGDEEKAMILVEGCVFPFLSRFLRLLPDLRANQEATERWVDIFINRLSGDAIYRNRILAIHQQTFSDDVHLERIKAGGGAFVPFSLSDKLFLSEIEARLGGQPFVIIPTSELPLGEYETGDLLSTGKLLRLYTFADFVEDTTIWGQMQAIFKESVAARTFKRE